MLCEQTTASTSAPQLALFRSLPSVATATPSTTPLRFVCRLQAPLRQYYVMARSAVTSGGFLAVLSPLLPSSRSLFYIKLRYKHPSALFPLSLWGFLLLALFCIGLPPGVSLAMHFGFVLDPLCVLDLTVFFLDALALVSVPNGNWGFTTSSACGVSRPRPFRQLAPSLF